MLITILKYQVNTDSKNQGKMSFLNIISPETQETCNTMSCLGQRNGMMTTDDYKLLGKPEI